MAKLKKYISKKVQYNAMVDDQLMKIMNAASNNRVIALNGDMANEFNEMQNNSEQNPFYEDYDNYLASRAEGQID